MGYTRMSIQTKIRKDDDTDILSNKDIICKPGQIFFKLQLWMKEKWVVLSQHILFCQES